MSSKLAAEQSRRDRQGLRDQEKLALEQSRRDRQGLRDQEKLASEYTKRTHGKKRFLWWSCALLATSMSSTAQSPISVGLSPPTTCTPPQIFFQPAPTPGAWLLLSCGPTNSWIPLSWPSIKPTISVSPPGEVLSGRSVQLTSDTPVQWSLAPGSLGALSSINSVTATYTAPQSISMQDTFGGCPLGPNDSVYYVPIDSLPTEPTSTQMLSQVAPYNLAVPLYAGYPLLGAYYFNAIVDWPFPKTMVKAFYGLESALVPNYSGTMVGVEAGQMVNAGDGGDHHVNTVLVNDQGLQGSCRWYETYQNVLPMGVGLTKGSCWGSDALDCNTSSILTYGPVSYSLPTNPTGTVAITTNTLFTTLAEIKGNSIRHAQSVTVGAGFARANIFRWPAQYASNNGGSDNTFVQIGSRIRLRSSFDQSSYSPYARSILSSWKTYGFIVTDTYMYGVQPVWAADVNEDPAVAQAVVEALGAVRGTDLQVVDTSKLATDPKRSLAVDPTNLLGPGGTSILPKNFGYVVARGASTSTGVNIPLRGVVVGVPEHQLTVACYASPYTFQLKSWVTGTANQGVTWSLVSGPGAVTASGLYIVPTTSSVVGPNQAVLQATSVADLSSKTNVYVSLLPSSPDGNFRMVLSAASQLDSNRACGVGCEWWRTFGLEGMVRMLDHDYPVWSSVSGREQNIRQYGAFFYSDAHLKFVVPNGNYKLRLLFGTENYYCLPTNFGPGDSPVPDDYHQGSGIFINVANQLTSSNYMWGNIVPSCQHAWDYYAPAAVSQNILDVWMGKVVLLGGGSSPIWILSALEIIPTNAAPGISIDTGLESWDYAGGGPTTQAVKMAGGQSHQFRVVGWFGQGPVVWSASSGKIDSTGLFVAPTVVAPQTAVVTATAPWATPATATASISVVP